MRETINLKQNIDSNKTFITLLAVLLAFHFFSNAYLLTKNPLPEGKDSYAHIMGYLNFSDILQQRTKSLFYQPEKSLFYNIFFSVFDYPVFFYLTVFFINMIFGNFIFYCIIFTSTVFFLLLLIAVYKIGCFLNPQTGILAAVICSSFPIVFITARHFNLEIALSALVCVSIWMLLRTNFFTERLFSILLGIILGLGMLTKQSFLIYVLGPIAIILYKCLVVRDRDIFFTSIRNIIFCFAIALLLSFYFYSQGDIYMNINTRINFTGAVNGNNIFQTQHLMYYVKSLTLSLGWGFTLLLIFSLFSIRKITQPLRFLLIAWFIFPLLVFTFIKIKYTEYSIAYLPAAAIISGSAISLIRNIKLKKILIISILVMATVNFFMLSYFNFKSFFTTYYYQNLKGELIESDQITGISQIERKTEFKDLLKKLGNSGKAIGIFYDDINLQFPAYFTRFISVETKKQVQILDMLFRIPLFFNKLDRIDSLIFVSCSGQDWISEKSFFKFEQDLNKQTFYRYKFRPYFLERILAAKKNFILTHKLGFETTGNKLQKENIFIYKRMP
ncbi:MAG: glycosyltransferase family 39 protein [Candidatus Omnitrophota bacterium]